MLVMPRRRRSRLQTHADRLHAISVTVKSGVYTCIAIVFYLSLNFLLAMLDLQRWQPFALSVFLIFCALLASLGVYPRRNDHEPDGMAVRHH